MKEKISKIPGKKGDGRSTKDLRYRDEGNLKKMGSTATKIKVKMLAIWNLVRACLREASGKYNAEIEEGAAALEEAKEIASQASRRKPKQLRQQTKDKKEKKESSSEGSTSDSDRTDSDSDVCTRMFRWRLRHPNHPPLCCLLLPPIKMRETKGESVIFMKSLEKCAHCCGGLPSISGPTGATVS